MPVKEEIKKRLIKNILNIGQDALDIVSEAVADKINIPEKDRTWRKPDEPKRDIEKPQPSTAPNPEPSSEDTQKTDQNTDTKGTGTDKDKQTAKY